MILVTDGCSKERHEAITQELIDGPLIAMYLVECYLKKAIEERVHGFRSDALRNGSGIGKVAEQYSDLFPFPLQSASRGQNFLGKVFGGVGQGFAFVVWVSRRF